MELNQDEVFNFLAKACTDIFNGETYDLSFDEIYSTVINISQNVNVDFFLKAISTGLEVSLRKDRDDLFKLDGEDFNQLLYNIIERVIQSFSHIKACFRAIFMGELSANCDAEMFKQFRQIIFAEDDNSNKIYNFLIKYAHTLPGAYNVDKDVSMVKLLQQLLYPSELWNLFIDHLCESTDALCLYVSSTLISQEPCKNNSIAYLSAVLDFFANEEKLWKILPNSDHEKLHHLAVTSLIYDIKDEYLFTNEQKSLIARAFFEDLRNLDILKRILNLFINDSPMISEFILALFGYFQAVMDKLGEEPANSLQASLQVTQTIIDTFEKIGIIKSETILGNSPIFNDTFEDFKRRIISKDSLNFESNSAKAIGMKISNVCSDPSKEKDLNIFVTEVGKLISYSDNKLLFIETHNSLMFGRLCMYAGKQYKLEHNVLNILEPYMPPSLSDSFQEKLKAFEESEEINKQWSVKPFGKNLSVFILSSTKASNLNTKFSTLKLPPEMQHWQDEFSTFYQSLKNKHVKITYIYEDNLVEMNVRFPKCPNQFTLKSPLIFSVVMQCIVQRPGSSFLEISQATGLKIKDIEAVVAKGATSKDFLIYKIVKKPNPEQTQVFFNMDFASPKQRFNVMLPNRFKLNLDTAEMMKSKRLKLYQSNITKVVKDNGRVDANDISNLVRSTLPQGIQFSLDEFNESLRYLIEKGYIRRNGRYYQYLE